LGGELLLGTANGLFRYDGQQTVKAPGEPTGRFLQ
jgi:hypothetical protein